MEPRHQRTTTEVALDQGDFPERVGVVERDTHPTLDVTLQRLLVAVRRQCDPSEVLAEVEVRVVLPARRPEGDE